MNNGYGMTIPFPGIALADHRDLFRELVDLGYTDVWSSEADAADAFTPLALAAAWAPELRLGTAIVPAFTRGPALMAQSVASLASAAPGRLAFGLGSSSNVIVERWNGIDFAEPYKRTRDMSRFLQLALSGEKADEDFSTFSVRGFRLGLPVPHVPSILIAVLREGMLRLAGRESDGAIINWLAAGDVPTVTAVVREAANAAGRPEPEVVARIFVCPSSDAETVRGQARRAIAAYLNVEVYAEFHRWLGRGPQLQGMWDNWQAGDRKAAVAAIPDDVVDALVVHGSPSQCKDHIQRYVDAGVTTPALAVMPFAGVDPVQAARDLAP